VPPGPGLPEITGSTGSTATPGRRASIHADYIGGDVPPAVKTRDEYFNPLAFRTATRRITGLDRKRNHSGSRYCEFRYFAVQEFQESERWRLQLRLETFNTAKQ